MTEVSAALYNKDMSSRRFPRTKYVRRLIQIENELESWRSYLMNDYVWCETAGQRAALDDRIGEMETLAQDIHRLADRFYHMPSRMRDLQGLAMDRSRG